MIVVIKKYGRWNESCNFQLESRKEKEMDDDTWNNAVEYAGFAYNKQHDEYYTVSEDKLRMTVVYKKQGQKGER